MADIEIVVKAKDQASATINALGGNVDKLATKARNAGLAMIAMGTAAAVGLGVMIKKYADAGEQIHDMSLKTGIATESLSRMKYIADLSNTSLESITTAIRAMSNALLSASEGNAAAITSFERLGLNVEDLMKLSPEERFWAIATAVGTISDANIRAAAAADVFGRSAMDLLPLLASGSAGIQQMTDDANEFAPIFSEQAAAKCNEFNDSLDRMKASILAAVAPLAEQLMPGVENLVTWFTNLVKKTGEWIAQHPVLADAIKALVAIFVGVGGFLVAIWAIHKAVVAVTTAMAIMQALSGPAGWATLAAGVLVAAGSIMAINKLMGATTGTAYETMSAEQLNAAAAAAGMTLQLSEKTFKALEKAATTSGAPTSTGGGTEEEMPEEVKWGGAVARMEWNKAHGYARGAIFNKPTIGLFGEAGPEAVVPLSGGGFGAYAPTLIFNVGNYMGDEISRRELVQDMLDGIREDQRRTVGRKS